MFAGAQARFGSVCGLPGNSGWSLPPPIELCRQLHVEELISPHKEICGQSCPQHTFTFSDDAQGFMFISAFVFARVHSMADEPGLPGCESYAQSTEIKGLQSTLCA